MLRVSVSQLELLDSIRKRQATQAVTLEQVRARRSEGLTVKAIAESLKCSPKLVLRRLLQIHSEEVSSRQR